MLPGNTPTLMASSRFRNGNDQYTSLLAHFDGALDSTVMPDSSIVRPKGNAIVATPARLNTSIVKFGTSSLLMNSGGYILWPCHADFDFPAGTDFTIDWWEYLGATTDGMTTFGGYTEATYQNIMLCYHYAGYQRCFMSSDGANWDIGGGGRNMGPISLNQWKHFALTRQGTGYRTFQNGSQQDYWIDAKTPYPAGGTAGYIGLGRAQAQSLFNGLVDEFRISKGIARWTANFTPPTSPYG